MNVEWHSKTVSLSVGELSSWTADARHKSDASSFSSSAMQDGSHWHKRLRERAAEQYGNCASFEIKITGEHHHAGWNFKLEGRIDQWIHISDDWTLLEIKTISESLPANEFWLRLRYPEYFSQAGCYFFLLSSQLQHGQSLSASLLFVDRQTGSEQSVLLHDEDLTAWQHAIERLTLYLESRHKSLWFWKRSKPSPLYSQWRPEQATLLQARSTLYRNADILALQAPTGSGKTGVLWQWALDDLRESNADRIVYLTGRSSGQWHAAECLRRTIPDDQGGRSLLWHMQRPRTEHCEHHSLQCSRYLPAYETLLQQLPDLLENGTIPLDKWIQMSIPNGYCAYELSRKISGISPIWIADYNYFLGRQSNRILRTDFSPERTILIIDEAHNLENRLLDHWSVTWNATDIISLLPTLSNSGAARTFIALWEQWAEFLSTLKGDRLLQPDEIQYAESLLFELSQKTQSENWDWNSLPAELADRLWRLRDHSNALSDHTSSWDWIWWSPNHGALQCTPLQMHHWLSQELQSYHRVYLASAFLPKSIPIVSGIPSLQSDLPWRERAYQVALDLRVNTRYENRKEGLVTIAQSFIDLCQTDTNPVIAFFPSYHYAESVLAYVNALAPEILVVCQPSNAGAQEQRTFLETSLLTARGIFLIMGSFAGEGIDVLGGRVTSAMVVSPALPEVNALREARTLNQNTLQPGTGFLHYYLEPGCSRVQQALGRLVRAPQHKARVVLVCERFAQPQYQRALDPLFANGTRIQTTQQWQEWVHTTSEGLPSV